MYIYKSYSNSDKRGYSFNSRMGKNWSSAEHTMAPNRETAWREHFHREDPSIVNGNARVSIRTLPWEVLNRMYDDGECQ